MDDAGPDADVPLIAQTSPRAVFAELLAQALGDTGLRPSPMATAYLIGLLEERVRVPAAAVEPDTLAEAWLGAARTRGPTRIRHLRRLGDRALFVSGFFAESLVRSVVSGRYYRDLGRSAYAAVAADLAAGAAPGRGWPELFAELADRFPELVTLLSEVGDRAHAGAAADRPRWLLGLYERYLTSGSEHDRRRLLRAGMPPPSEGRVRWQ